MVPLAKAFVDRGDEVRWATAAEVAPRLEREGFEVDIAGTGLSESLRELRLRFPELEKLPQPDWPDFMFPRLFGTIRAAPMLADLLPVARAFQPSVIVSDQAELAGPVAAAATGVASVTHAFGGLLPRSRVDAAGRAVAHLWEEQGLEPRPFGGTYDHLYLDIYPASLQRADAGHVPFSQPLRPVAFATGGQEPLATRITGDASTPLVYVTFGTVFNTDAALIATVAAALRELPLRVIVTLGPTADPALLGAQPANVHVARYIPQTQLLPHCTAVVSHAGSGTLLATLAQGLPQLCLPQAADQFANAQACVDAGAGRALPPGAVTIAHVRGEIEDVLGDVSLRAAAERVRGEIADMPGPAEVAEIVATRFGREPRRWAAQERRTRAP